MFGVPSRQITTSTKESISAIIAMGAQISSSTVSVETLIAKRLSDKLLQADLSSYDKAICIASTLPRIMEFIEENEITNIYASLYEDLWIIEFYAIKGGG